MAPNSKRPAPDPSETIQELIGENPTLKDELAALKTMFDVREDRHNELIEDKERKILDIGYKLASEISRTERQGEENAKLRQLVATAETHLGTEVSGHAETTNKLRLLEKRRDQLVSRLNLEQERVKKLQGSEDALNKEKHDLVEQLREAKDVQDSQQVQFDSLKDAAKLSASNIMNLESQVKDLQSRGNQMSEGSRKDHKERTITHRYPSVDTIEIGSESENDIQETVDEHRQSLRDRNDGEADTADVAVNPAAAATKPVGSNQPKIPADLEQKRNNLLGRITEGQERMQLIRDWLRTNNKSPKWWRLFMTLIENSNSVKQAVERINKAGYERRILPGNGGFAGPWKRRKDVFELMSRDLETAVRVLKEELNKKDDPGKCR
jgi:hypothetical protein